MLTYESYGLVNRSFIQYFRNWCGKSLNWLKPLFNKYYIHSYPLRTSFSVMDLRILYIFLMMSKPQFLNIPTYVVVNKIQYKLQLKEYINQYLIIHNENVKNYDFLDFLLFNMSHFIQIILYSQFHKLLIISESLDSKVRMRCYYLKWILLKLIFIILKNKGSLARRGQKDYIPHIKTKKSNSFSNCFLPKPSLLKSHIKKLLFNPPKLYRKIWPLKLEKNQIFRKVRDLKKHIHNSFILVHFQNATNYENVDMETNEEELLNSPIQSNTVPPNKKGEKRPREDNVEVENNKEDSEYRDRTGKNQESLNEKGIHKYYFPNPVSGLTSDLIKGDKIKLVKTWEDITRNHEEGRKLLSKIWRDLGLNRTADYLENKNICSINSVRKLYERLKYIVIDKNNYLDKFSNTNKNKEKEFLYEGDQEFLEEVNYATDQDLHYVIFEGNYYKSINEFGNLLLKNINQQIISQDFHMRSIGVTKFIVGFTQHPPLDKLEEKMPEYRLSKISYKDVINLIKNNTDKTSGIVFFRNNMDMVYTDVQNAVAELRADVRALVKRIILKKNIIILFVPTDKMINFANQVRSLSINGKLLVSGCNLAPEFFNGSGKLIIENSIIDRPTTLKKFLIERLYFSQDSIGEIIQIKKSKAKDPKDRVASFIIWLNGKEAIDKALLSVLYIVSGVRNIGFFRWPKSKNTEVSPISMNLIE